MKKDKIEIVETNTKTGNGYSTILFDVYINEAIEEARSIWLNLHEDDKKKYEIEIRYNFTKLGWEKIDLIDILIKEKLEENRENRARLLEIAYELLDQEEESALLLDKYNIFNSDDLEMFFRTIPRMEKR